MKEKRLHGNVARRHRRPRGCRKQARMVCRCHRLGRSPQSAQRHTSWYLATTLTLDQSRRRRRCVKHTLPRPFPCAVTRGFGVSTNSNLGRKPDSGVYLAVTLERNLRHLTTSALRRVQVLRFSPHVGVDTFPYPIHYKGEFLAKRASIHWNLPGFSHFRAVCQNSTHQAKMNCSRT